jgi:hypothetical protein
VNTRSIRLPGRLGGLFCALALLFVPSSAASKPPAPGPLQLVRDNYTYSLNPDAPAWCLNEDDTHYREWSDPYLQGGYLYGTLTASDYFCDPYVDYSGGRYWDGGGGGYLVSVRGVGTLQTLTLSSPGGSFYQWPQPTVVQGQLVSSEVVGTGHGGVTWNTYAACVFVNGQNNSNPGRILTGTWTMTLTGQFSQVNVELTAEMFGIAANGYPAHCPEGQKPPYATY